MTNDTVGILIIGVFIVVLAVMAFVRTDQDRRARRERLAERPQEPPYDWEKLGI